MEVWDVSWRLLQSSYHFSLVEHDNNNILIVVICNIEIKKKKKNGRILHKDYINGLDNLTTKKKSMALENFKNKYMLFLLQSKQSREDYQNWIIGFYLTQPEKKCCKKQ